MRPIIWPTYVPDVNDLIALSLDSIAWQRKTTGAGTYVDLTDAVAAKASMTGTVTQTFVLQGKSLVVTYKGVTYTVDFVAADPHAITVVVSAVNAVLPGTMAFDSGGKLKLETAGTGTAEIIQIGDGDANVILGFDEDQLSVGKDAHVTLVTDQLVYGYTDSSGDPEYWYHYRFEVAATGDHTEWSADCRGYQGSPVAVAKLCRGTIKLMDADGTPFRGQEILVASPKTADGVVISGTEYSPLGSRTTVETDDNGEASLWVLRGALLDLSIEGTGLVRRVTIPDAATANLLDPAISDGDLFEVQTFDVPLATRTI